MQPIALLALAALLATPAGASGPAPDPQAAAAAAQIRAMAEIDGDPATFTGDERAKLALLRQVLGTAPTAPRGRLAGGAEVNGALDEAGRGP